MLQHQSGGSQQRRCHCALLRAPGIEREETLALGDSESDFYMADHVGMFCLVENGLTSAGAPEFLDACDNAYITRGKIVDGWVATTELLVAARS